MKKKLIGLGAAAVILLVSLFLPGMGGLTRPAVTAVGILLASLVLWITEAFPISVTTLLMICILGLTDIIPFSEAVSGISTNTALFIMASSAITVAVSQSSIPQRISGFLIARYHDRPRRLVLFFGLVVAVCSAFMSSLATCALFACIVDAAFPQDDPGKLRRSLMLAVPACAGIGGFMTPAGTPANVLLLELFAGQGHPLTFAQWSAIGFPVGLVAVVIFMTSLILYYRPAFGGRAPVAAVREVPPSRDRLTLLIVGAVIVCWFAGSWLPNVSITLVAVVGMGVMFCPKVELLTWDSFSRGVNWDLVITMGTVSVLMEGVSRTGAMAWLADRLIAPLAALPALPLLIALSLAICCLRAFIPTTTAVVTLLGPMLIGIAAATRQSAACLLMTLAFWTASALLLVYTEPIYLITYSTGRYKAGDLLRIGALPCLILAALNAFLIPALLGLVGV